MSRTLFSLFAAIVLVTATGGVLFAQDKGADGNVQYKSKTVYDFDDDTVEGDLVRPDGEFVDTRKGAKHSSLIKIRENFIPEMIKSAEDI
jgi:hypothetical protein